MIEKILSLYYIMNIGSILLIIAIIILLYIAVRYIVNDVNTLTGITSGTTQQTIEASSLATDGSNPNQSNFAYSIWFNIDDWTYRYGKPKVLFGRMGQQQNANGTAENPCPLVALGAIENNLIISLTLSGCTATEQSTENTALPNNMCIHRCIVSNVPIQKWVNLLISVYGQTLDVYMDGKLVKTCVMPGIAQIYPEQSVFVTPYGGFSGWTAKFQYYPNALNPQEAWDIYQKGYGQSWLSSIFGRYQIKVSFIENGTENNSFTI
jgi:hypothetical protein